MKNIDEFKEKFNLQLNPQQEQAVTSEDRACLLLAVPGSGKTSVIVAKLGYMICVKKIAPSTILAVSFNRLAASEIRKRFEVKFGKENAEGLSIQTINSLSLAIYSKFCRDTGHPYREIIDQKEKRGFLLNVYRKHSDEQFPSESDISEVETAFSYIKNMGISIEEGAKKFSSIEGLKDMYTDYERFLKSKAAMDFDDQMIFAKWILEHAPAHRRYWQERYRYICVDEAQDTSKIQHDIIRILAEKNSLFMVGDEDQSIYGFRGAYPEALLSFEKTYMGGRVIKMETNYRSTGEIVKTASKFVNGNRNRFKKNMKAVKGEGKEVSVIEAPSRTGQYRILFTEAEECKGSTAFLYRDNESGIPLADRLLRKKIPFNYNGGKAGFFTSKVVQDYIAFLKLIYDNENLEAFGKIGTKSGMGLSRDYVNYLTAVCSRRHLSLFDELSKKEDKRGNIERFINIIKDLKKSASADALRKVRTGIYAGYRERYGIDDSSAEILIALAEMEPDICEFLKRLEVLADFCENPPKGNMTNRITLSTIHSSKGMEFDKVYIFDVFDGKLPSADEENLQEERRLFYVAMTRAAKELHIIRIRRKKSSFTDELFGKKTGSIKAGNHPSDLIKRLHKMHTIN